MKEEINLINCHNDLKKKFKTWYLLLFHDIVIKTSIVMNLKNNDKNFQLDQKNKILKKF